MSNFFDSLFDRLRAAPLLVWATPLLALAILWNPAKLGLAVYALAKLLFAAWCAYWIDRLAYRKTDRPHLQVRGEDRRAAWYRRALIIAACILFAGMVP